MINRVISGGQTGIDQLGLWAAKQLGIPTGGTAPKGYRTEAGANYLLKVDYGLSEHVSAAYEPRTGVNVHDADGTLLLGNTSSSGSRLTIQLCKQHQKPFLINPTLEQFNQCVKEHNIQVLNVAGNRKSKLTATQLMEYKYFLLNALPSSSTE